LSIALKVAGYSCGKFAKDSNKSSTLHKRKGDRNSIEDSSIFEEDIYTFPREIVVRET